MEEERKKTYIALVLDRSGSMSETKKQAISSFNEQVQQMKENSKEQDIFCSLVTFNGHVFEHLWLKRAEELEETTDEGYKPEGSTAMRDAMGYVIEKLQETTDPNDPNNAYLIIVISDGWENASQHISTAALREMIEGCQKTKRWTFTYMGCSEDNLADLAQATNIPLANMASWNAGNAARAMRVAGSRTGDYLRSRKLGATEASCYYSGVAGQSLNMDDVSPDFQTEVVNAVMSSTSQPDQNAVSSGGAPHSVKVNVFGQGGEVSWKERKKHKK